MTGSPDVLDGLTPEQREAVERFVNTQRAYAAHMRERTDVLLAKRNEALIAAREARVAGTVLAQAAGLSHGRIYQLAAQLGITPWHWWSDEADHEAECST